MSLKITHKYSTAAGTPPASGDIDVGEIAINAADAELYTKDNAGNIKKFANTDTTGTAAGVQFTQSGTGAVQRTVESKLRDVVSVRDFIPPSTDTATTNCTGYIQAAIDSVSAYGTVYFDGARYKTNGVITFSTSNVNVHFDGTTFLVGDTGTSGTTVSGATVKIGFHFKEADGVHVTGSATFVGQGTPGSTWLLGVMFDNCDDVSCPAFMRFENMAVGRNMTICTRGTWGDAYGDTMWGYQPFAYPSTDNAGTVNNIVGCTYCRFGDTYSYNTEKPAVYLSVGTGASDNKFCTFGSIVCQGRTGSISAHALALRSAVDCSFGPIIVENVKYGAYIVQYPQDSAYLVDRVYIESVQGSVSGSMGSTQAAISQVTTSTSRAIGTVSVGSVDTTVAGTHGILVTSGTLNVGMCKITSSPGNARQVVVNSDGSDVVTFNVGTLVLDPYSASNTPVSIGDGGAFSASAIDVLSGPNGGATTFAIRYDPAFGTASSLAFQGARIDSLKYRKGVAAFDFLYVAGDLTNSFESWDIKHIDGSGSAAQARFAGNAFSILRGRIASTVTPTTGTYSQGTVLWRSNPSAGGSPGWVCVTGGTPGTWKEMASLAA